MLPYEMFDIARSAAEAKRAEKLSNIYHKGHQLAWDGRSVLASLIEKHGGVHMEPRYVDAITRVFSILMWGELGAWKISAQLSDKLVELEPKMAATSQVFDGARHFYVLHDYLSALGHVPGPPDRHTQTAINLVLATDSLAAKLIGMQMMFEPIALTIFKLVREMRLDPVLADLLVYFEKDEARHIGLGVQALPHLISEMWPHEHAWLMAFQVRLAGHVLLSLHSIEPALNVLGVKVRDVLEAGIMKHHSYSSQLLDNVGLDLRLGQVAAQRGIVALCEVFFPAGDRSARSRLAHAARVLRHGPDFLKRPQVEAAATN